MGWKDYMLGIMGAMLGFFLVRLIMGFDAMETRMENVESRVMTTNQAILVLEARLDTFMKLRKGE